MSCAATPDGWYQGCADRVRQNRRVSGHQPRWRVPCATETRAWCKREAQLYTALPRCKHRSNGSDELIQMMLIWACADVSVICTTVSCGLQVGPIRAAIGSIIRRKYSSDAETSTSNM